MPSPEVAVVALLTETDWPEVMPIYAAGIATGHATFDAEVPSWATFDAAKDPDLRLVARGPSGRVVGGVWAAPTSIRPAYAGVVEHSLYVAPEVAGRGVGRTLLDVFVPVAEAGGVWTIQSGIFPENVASLALHAAAGFRVVGVRERIAQMTHGPLAGTWRDVVLVERRSRVVG